MKSFIHRFPEGEEPETDDGWLIEEAGFILPAEDWSDVGTFEHGHDMISIGMDSGANVEGYYRAMKEDPTTPLDFIDGMEAAFKEREERRSRFHIVSNEDSKARP